MIYHFSKTGGIISLALKFIGTGNQKLRKIIFEYLDEISKIKINENVFVVGSEVKDMLDEYSFNVI
jgi:hypothetical protein